jgi:putative hydrolase of the HAD superfamily
VKYSKPSTYCFHKILQWERANPKDLIYIGDNPKKDFVNLKKDGFRTIQVLTGEHKEVEVPLEYEADFRVYTLDDLSNKHLKSMFGY